MKKLYKFGWAMGHMGEVEGLFIADEKEVKEAIGKNVYFGKILGKHSNVFGPLENEDLTVLSEDQNFISQLILCLGGYALSGYNPLLFISEEGGDDDS